MMNIITKTFVKITHKIKKTFWWNYSNILINTKTDFIFYTYIFNNNEQYGRSFKIYDYYLIANKFLKLNEKFQFISFVFYLY